MAPPCNTGGVSTASERVDGLLLGAIEGDVGDTLGPWLGIVAAVGPTDGRDGETLGNVGDPVDSLGLMDGLALGLVDGLALGLDVGASAEHVPSASVSA